MAYGLFGWKDSPFNMPLRLLFFIGGAMMLFPGIQVTLAGCVVVIAALVFNKLIKTKRTAAPHDRRLDNSDGMSDPDVRKIERIGT